MSLLRLKLMTLFWLLQSKQGDTDRARGGNADTDASDYYGPGPKPCVNQDNGGNRPSPRQTRARCGACNWRR